MDVIYMFAGSNHAMAYSTDKSGSNLPAEYAPWNFRGDVPTDGPTFRAGIDKIALEEVKAQGYSIRIFTMEIDATSNGKND